MAGIGVILNPNSRRYRSSPTRLSRMSFMVGEKADFQATKNLEDLNEVITGFRDKNIDILALSGGDGTNHRTLSTLIQVYGTHPLPKIALLRGGTVNTTAGSFGIRGNPEKLLMNVIYKYHARQAFKTVITHPMKINDDYGFIWGIGVVNRFMEAYYEKGKPSVAHAAWVLTKAISSATFNTRFACDMFEPFDAEVAIDGNPWPFRNYSCVFAGGIRQIGLGCNLFHYVDNKTHFHASAFCMKPRNILIPHLPRMFMGKALYSPNILESPAQRLSIRLQQPMAFTIDGDMYSGAQATDYFLLEQGPGLEIIVE